MATRRAVRLSELRDLPPEEREEVLSGLIEEARANSSGAGATANGYLSELNEQIEEFERRYEISSERLLEELYEGTRTETADIARWLMLLRLRERREA